MHWSIETHYRNGRIETLVVKADRPEEARSIVERDPEVIFAFVLRGEGATDEG